MHKAYLLHEPALLPPSTLCPQSTRRSCDRRRGPRPKQHGHRPPAALGAELSASISALRGGAAGVGALLESAHPLFYFAYLCCAGLGIPLSEDALVVWVGARCWRGGYGSLQSSLAVLGIVYAGVVVSDLMTFTLGALVHRVGFLSGLRRESSAARAIATVQRHSRTIGIVQRFSVGFRGPLCLAAGITGVPLLQFAGGACLGALGTMGLQLSVGYAMRQMPNVYLSTLALVGLPTLIGGVTGPLATLLGFWWAGRRPRGEAASAPAPALAPAPASAPALAEANGGPPRPPSGGAGPPAPGPPPASIPAGTGAYPSKRPGTLGQGALGC